MRQTIRTLALLVAPLALPGCGPSGTVQVTGKLLKAGAPYTPPEGQTLGVTFYAMEVKDTSGQTAANSEPYAANVNPAEGTFVVPGPEGRGVPPGKYRVSVIQKMTREALEKANASVTGKKPVDRDTDFLKDKFGPANSPIVRELTSSCDLAIDLDKPGETARSP
jgi:hypothetical protein